MDPYVIDQVVAAVTAAAWAGAAAAVVLVVVVSGARRFPSWRDRALPIALAAGFLAGYAAAEGMPATRPLEAWQWIPWIALVAGAAAILHGTHFHGPWILLVALALPVAYVTVLTKTPVWVLGVGLAILVAAIVLGGAAHGASPPAFLASITAIASATALTIAVSGTLRIGALCGTLAGAAGACFVLARWFPAPVKGAVPLVALLLPAFSLNGILYADVPIASGVLLALALLGLWVPDTALRRLTKPWQKSAARVAAVAAVAGTALAIAVHASPPFGG